MTQIRQRAVVELETAQQLASYLAANDDLSRVVLNGIDLTPHADALLRCSLNGAVLIGCVVPEPVLAYASLAGAAVFPAFDELPYRPYRTALYRPEDLYFEFDPDEPESYDQTLDARVYAHWQSTGGQGGADIVESLARRIHDHSITGALEDFIADREVVAIMGGHGVRRDEEGFARVCRVARFLARTGKLMASGGGPGAMEATHLGCWLAEEPDRALDDAIALLSDAPAFEDPGPWLAAAFAVRDRYGGASEATRSLGIPTWLYGHEPPNAFATHIAKYFANAVREDGLLSIATHGVVFTPGSAGTVQEVFQDVTQNHYETMGPPSPMVFLGTRFWTERLPVMALIEALGTDKPWLENVLVTDDEEECAAFITSHRR